MRYGKNQGDQGTQMKSKSLARKVLKLVNGYQSQGGYIIISRIPNSKKIDCYHVSSINEHASYGLSYLESKKLIILKFDLRKEYEGMKILDKIKEAEN